MSEHGEGSVTETRGGEDIDWENVKPGEPLPEKEPDPEPVKQESRPPGWDNGDWWF